MGGQADAEVEETPEMEEKRKEKEEMKVNRKVSREVLTTLPSGSDFATTKTDTCLDTFISLRRLRTWRSRTRPCSRSTGCWRRPKQSKVRPLHDPSHASGLSTRNI